MRALHLCVITIYRQKILKVLQFIHSNVLHCFQKSCHKLLTKRNNIAYPVAAAIVYGDFGLTQVLEENLGNDKVIDMMNRLSFNVDSDLDARFPVERICRAEIITKDGKRYLSGEYEPRGEAKENISVDWLCDKFKRITAPVLSSDGQDDLIELITGNDDLPIRAIVDAANNSEYYK